MHEGSLRVAPIRQGGEARDAKRAEHAGLEKWKAISNLQEMVERALFRLL